MIEKALRAILIADADINAIVEGRFYPLHLPQDAALPSLVYERVSTKPTYSYQGDSGLDRARFQIDACAADPEEAFTLGGLVEKRLSGLRTHAQGHDIEIFFENATDAHETGYENLAEIYRRIMDFYVWYSK